DHITSDTTLTLSGTAEASSTVTVFDGVTQLGTATADGSGNWTFDTSTLSDGAHSFTAKTADAAGNQSGASAALDVTVDTTALGTPTIVSFADDTGIEGDRVTSDNTLTLSGTAEASSTVTVFDGVTQLGTAMADGSGNWTFDTSTLSEGVHSF